MVFKTLNKTFFTKVEITRFVRVHCKDADIVSNLFMGCKKFEAPEVRYTLVYFIIVKLLSRFCLLVGLLTQMPSYFLSFE